MASLKDVRLKISGVRKTKQITKAMYMVSSAKLRGAQGRIQRFRSYAEAFRAMLRDVVASSPAGDVPHPLLAPRQHVERVGIVLVTSDRGLCGSFNANLAQAALKLARAKEAEGKKVLFYCVGRKGREMVRKNGFSLARVSTGSLSALDFQVADRLGEEVTGAFLERKLDEVFFLYGEFKSMLRQEPVATLLLPLEAGGDKAGEKTGRAPRSPGADYLYEPKGAALMEALLPRVIKAVVYRGLLDTSASEHAARMTAMDNATRNCDELIGNLTRLFNKTRQAAITTDLIDIVGGVEALKG
jgi:F-type H+-transporting ATPase subunit gamma